MLNKELERTLNEAFAIAKSYKHEFMTVEHLLIALLTNASVREAMDACNADIINLKSDLKKFIEQTTPIIPEESQSEYETQPTLSFQRVLQRAVFHAKG